MAFHCGRRNPLRKTQVLATSSTRLPKDLTPQEFPGATSIYAVDAARGASFITATAKDRYMPFRERVPEEILTIANRIIGSGQTSLNKIPHHCC